MKDDDTILTKFWAGDDCRHWFYIAEDWYPNKVAYKAPHMTPCADVKKLPELRQTDAGKSVKK